MSVEARDIGLNLASYDTGTLYEAAGSGALTGLRALTSDQRIGGSALTVACSPGDNLAIHSAVAEAKPGEVLVVQTHDPSFGVWGEVLTVAAMSRGVRALIIDGCIRDLDAIRSLGFPVFARATALTGAAKLRRGLIRQPVSCGGQLIWPGDLMVADVSGVVVIRARAARRVLAAAESRRKKEGGIMAALRAGQTTIELLNLGPALERAEADD